MEIRPLRKRRDLYYEGNITPAKKVDFHSGGNVSPPPKGHGDSTHPLKGQDVHSDGNLSDLLQKGTFSIIIEIRPPPKGQDFHVDGT